jgi:prepilin-type N-terminal cleavage/methylation domain-containing protein
MGTTIRKSRNSRFDILISPNQSRRRVFTSERQRGFTLLEVMISLAVLAACLVVLFKLQSQTVDSVAESRLMTESLMLARAKMAEMEAAGFPELGQEEGDFGEKYPGYRWIRDVTETGVDALRKVSLVVTPPGTDNGPGTVRLETFLAKVEKASAAELAAAWDGATGGQGASSTDQKKSQSSASAAEAAPFPMSAAPEKPSGQGVTSGAQDPAAVFLPWLAPTAPRPMPPTPSGQIPFLPWLPKGGGAQTSEYPQSQIQK